MKPEPDWARAVALARRERGGRQSLVFAVFLAAGLHAAAGFASLGTASDVPVAQTREVDVMRHRCVATIVGVFSIGSSAAGTGNLLVNGGFEAGRPTPICNWVDLHAPSTDLPGWQVVSGSIDHLRFPSGCAANLGFLTDAIEGERLLDLDGVLQAGAIEQTISVSQGARYRLSFKLSGNNDCGGNTKRILVQCGSLSQEFQFDCTPIGQQSWVTKTIELESVSRNLTVRFTSLVGAGCGPLLDDVQLAIVLPCSGDVIANGIVDGADLAAVLAVWGTNGGIYPRADTNADGLVDATDLAVVLGGWGACP